ncbi:helix-turn-helix domain-containing protein [Kribbella sp. NPDC051718]|uniref:TetR/AcrR family transcriptional regulator n=1 Tax=Kribbella sp. NPDC051718 TaxID=3155168 RepID=UPI0034345A89
MAWPASLTAPDFRDGGIKLTLASVALEAGVSKGGLLYHFASKQALVDRLVGEFDAAIIGAGDTPGAATLAYLDNTVGDGPAAGDTGGAARRPHHNAPPNPSAARLTSRVPQFCSVRSVWLGVVSRSTGGSRWWRGCRLPAERGEGADRRLPPVERHTPWTGATGGAGDCCQLSRAGS